MLLRVRYNDNSYDMVKAWRLQELISSGRVAAFCRADGWVTIGRDPVRSGDRASYQGRERRHSDAILRVA